MNKHSQFLPSFASNHTYKLIDRPTPTSYLPQHALSAYATLSHLEKKSHPVNTSYNYNHQNHNQKKPSNGLNDQMMLPQQKMSVGRTMNSAIKENYLITKQNERKNRIKSIIKENKMIDSRISSQKSLYSSIELRKSFNANTEIKKRLSQSKLSQRSRSPSQDSKRNKPDGKLVNRLKQIKKIQIRTKGVQQMKEQQVNTFKKLFGGNHGNHNIQKRSNATAANNTHTTMKKEDALVVQNPMNLPSTRPYMQTKSTQRQRPPSTPQFPKAIIDNQEQDQKERGGLLHRIAEEMFNDKKGKGKAKQPIKK